MERKLLFYLVCQFLGFSNHFKNDIDQFENYIDHFTNFISHFYPDEQTERRIHLSARFYMFIAILSSYL
ncbi:hypothetical protein P343_13100 [Sporolactobacillus laevolacticus DSM 442]|uniref:Uncharacterized protein n=1 Tax=Sporolactobacillus laevolacticus DSM 442 TaxID=1395513 RepID=V6IVW6_9BACL|nr:hypothetical protein P343_13100 [Sporolactobacillus laevolacticus DSM 442]